MRLREALDQHGIRLRFARGAALEDETGFRAAAGQDERAGFHDGCSPADGKL